MKPILFACALACSVSAWAQTYYMALPLSTAAASSGGGVAPDDDEDEDSSLWLQVGLAAGDVNTLFVMEGAGYTKAYNANELNFTTAEVECLSSGAKLVANAATATPTYAVFSFDNDTLRTTVIDGCANYVLRYSTTQPAIDLNALDNGFLGGPGPSAYPGEVNLFICGVLSLEAGTLSPGCYDAGPPPPPPAA